ncbi:MAG TPA: uroporphyrinogen decarboxylase family protein [Candidatus Brocadiia bacterium]|nr:uroporphyrinogen decarboxylase family protein [Candidatus Brocadiia bacterium]
MSGMTSRERVLAAIAHKPTDRAPADYGAHQDVTDRLIAYLGVGDYEGLLRAFNVDMRRVHMNYYQPATGPDPDGYMRDMWGMRHRPADPGDGRPNHIPPFNEDSTVDDVHNHEWPDPAKLDYSGIRAQAEQYHEEYAVFGAPWSPFFHEAAGLIGQESFLLWMHTKPDVLKALIDCMTDYEVEATRRFFEAADGLVDIAYFGNDFGTQRGLFISPASWEQFMRKPLKRFFDVSHDFGCKVMKHSCGAVRDIIPMFIEDGVDILDPVQVRAAGMDLPGLVRDFGDRLCFHGAVDTQRTLPFGTVADVRAEVRSYLELMRPRGGYILCGSQEFIEDIPLANIVAIYDENCRIT